MGADAGDRAVEAGTAAAATTIGSPAPGEPPTDGVVVFGARWCPPWRKLRAQLDELDAAGKLQIVDVDEDPAAADWHRVAVVPCVVQFRDGRELTRLTGAVTAARIAALVGIEARPAPSRRRGRRRA